MASESEAAASKSAWATPSSKTVIDCPASNSTATESKSASSSVAAGDAWARPPSLPGTSPWSSTREVRAHVKMFSKLVGQYRWPWVTVRRLMGERKLAPVVDCEGVGRFAQAASSFVDGRVGTSRARPVDTTSMNCSRSRKRDEGFARLLKGKEAAVSNSVCYVWHGRRETHPVLERCETDEHV